jgi:hypothetical protein
LGSLVIEICKEKFKYCQPYVPLKSSKSKQGGTFQTDQWLV